MPQTEISPLRLLFVDDQPPEIIRVTEFANKDGHTVCVANSKQEALSLLEAEHFDVVFLDWELGDGNGVEVCSALRKQPDSALTYVIMLTGKRDEKAVIDALDVGANDFVLKPIDPTTFRCRLIIAVRHLELVKMARIEKTRTDKL